MIDKTQRAMLKRLAGTRTKAELKQLFALVRAHDDRALLAAAVTAPKKPKPKQAADTLLREIEAIMKPLMARSAEKGELLAEHFGKAIAPRGLADALKKLRATKLTDAQIRAGAKSMMADLGRKFDGRETVV